MIDDFGKYLRKATTIGFSVGIILICVLFVLISSYVWEESRKRQVAPWIEIFPQNVLSHLVENDYHPINSKIRLIRKTNLFNSLVVYDANKNRIDGFDDRLDGDTSSAKMTPIKDESGNLWGWYSFTENTSEHQFYMMLVVASTLVLLLITALAIKLVFNKIVVSKVARFSDLIHSIDKMTSKLKSSKDSAHLLEDLASSHRIEFREAEQLNSSIRKLMQEIQRVEQENFDSVIQHEKDRSLAEIASQVSHDIRSPLAALDLLLISMEELEEEKRILLRTAVERIRDIANTLLSKRRKLEEDTNVVRAVLCRSLIEEIISEKRILTRNHLGTQISFLHDPFSYRFFTSVNPQEFKRVLSNLLNNSIESLSSNKGKITIELKAVDNYISISITDTGKGMSEEVLLKLKESGGSFGKENGNGLGLQHAKKTISELGGNIEIESKIGEGTTVTVLVPPAVPPKWFVQEITINKGAKIVVLDDDQSIHDSWEKKLEVYRSELDYELIHLSTSVQLINYLTHASVDLFLIDYEIIGDSFNGVNLIKHLSIEEKSVLVTSRYDDDKIISECVESGIKLLPKSLSQFVPIYLG